MRRFPFHREDDPIRAVPAGWIVIQDDGTRVMEWNPHRHESELEKRLREFTCCGDPGDCSESRCR